MLLYSLSEQQVLNQSFTFNSAFHFVEASLGSSVISKMLASQLRYLRYYEQVNKEVAKHNMHLHKLKFSSTPSFKYSGGCGKSILIDSVSFSFFLVVKIFLTCSTCDFDSARGQDSDLSARRCQG